MLKNIFTFTILIVILKAQINNLPDNFVYLRQVDSSIIQEIRYAGYHNFVGKPINGYNAAECILTKQTAFALSQVQKQLLKNNQTLKVYDCYRPQKAVDEFVNWSSDSSTTMKEEFYPTLNKDELFPEYIAYKSGHSRGSTVDLTVVDLPAAEEPQYIPGESLHPCTNSPDSRWPDNSIDFGTGFDCFNHMAHTNQENVSIEVQERRQQLVQLLLDNNMKNYINEWWHYTLINEPYSTTYFDFNIDPINGKSISLNKNQITKIKMQKKNLKRDKNQILE
ncbi:Hedgehog signaling/DD-peptidase zinc-binding domain [Pseudocohnilembus persalinus]|uniref:Hedgehog signaling/DD-peptidase zinc-binding domain n=1 Tax=Pseudocohnilembus persalinus TaxID=266149 RepID=A0A0V0QYG3_PSEPJ|nr:Hedgehog signaling/DD-peptidase zinc-binding domain [Pseudocohnilembus persalinus]|eukprot:KRX07335.1 Hedgehog signaling/DD-peptidase zinc-binding domain [Pseudocohnilembus persalinus]